MLTRLRSRRSEPPRYSAAPDGLALYAIGDVHGRADCLQRAFAIMEEDQARLPAQVKPREIYIGDYVHRGPSSSAVIDALIDRAERRDVVFLRGNHEILLESYLRGTTSFEDWRRLGGLETVLSYWVDARNHLESGTLDRIELARKVPRAHLRFISQLRPYYEEDRYCFVHAGLRPGVALDQQTIQDLAWIREEFLESAGPFPFVVVHGHTPVPQVDLLRYRINIDTGAYITNRLSVVRIDANGVTVLPA